MRSTPSERGELAAIVTDGGPPVTQLGQKRTVATQRIPARWPAVAAEESQGHPGREEPVAARAMAGDPATGYPFMDIAAPCLPRALPPLRGSFDGSHSVEVAIAVAGGVPGVIPAVAAILALLGLLSLWGLSPSLSAKPLSPSGRLLPARATAVLGTEEILGARDEALAATFQEAKATGAILPRLGPCLRTSDALKKTSSLILASARFSGSQGLQLFGSLFSSHENAAEQGIKAEGSRAGFPAPSASREGERRR